MAKWDHDDLRDKSGDFLAITDPNLRSPGAIVNVSHTSNFVPMQSETILGTQVGGDHYTKQAIQPIEYIWANGIGFSEGNVIKYVTRWKDKGGIKDLEKAKHHLALLIEHAREQEKKGVKYGL